jgi:hypothetical protein
MSKRAGKKTGRAARPIRTKRDHKGASAVVKKLRSQADRDSTAELRLQSLLQEMDRVVIPEDDSSADLSEDEGYSGPRRRWSDGTRTE